MKKSIVTDVKKVIWIITMLSVIGTAVCVFFCKTSENKVILSAAIAFGTTAYHFTMRLGVGFLFQKIMHNRADYTKRWYQCSAWEKKVYKILNVKRWKRTMPTYDRNLFDPTKQSWDAIAQASCQAELVHETILLLSFVPIVFSIWFGAIMVFVITSVLASLFDLTFVILQRYNRPRIIRRIGRSI